MFGGLRNGAALQLEHLLLCERLFVHGTPFAFLKQTAHPLMQGKDAEGGDGDRELFSGDGLPSKPAAGGSSKVYVGGARSQKVKVSVGGEVGVGPLADLGSLPKFASARCKLQEWLLALYTLCTPLLFAPTAGAQEGRAEQDGAEPREARRQGQARLQEQGAAPAAVVQASSAGRGGWQVEAGGGRRRQAGLGPPAVWARMPW